MTTQKVSKTLLDVAALQQKPHTSLRERRTLVTDYVIKDLKAKRHVFQDAPGSFLLQKERNTSPISNRAEHRP